MPRRPAKSPPLPVSPGFPNGQSDPADPNAPETALVHFGERLTRSLGVARTLLRHGRAVDLTGMEDMVGQFCARLLDLPPERARPLLPLIHVLTALVEEITRLMTEAAPRHPAGSAKPHMPHAGIPLGQ